MKNFCKNCGAEIKGNFCENCGKSVTETNMINSRPMRQKRHGCLISILVILGFFIFLSIGTNIFEEDKETTDSKKNNAINESQNKENKKQEKEKQEKEKEEKKEDLELLSYDSISDNYIRYAVGEIKNNTDKTYSYVQVEINLYSGDSLVGSTLDNVNNLEPGDTWKFKAPILEEDCDSFKIVDITGF